MRVNWSIGFENTEPLAAGNTDSDVNSLDEISVLKHRNRIVFKADDGANRRIYFYNFPTAQAEPPDLVEVPFTEAVELLLKHWSPSVQVMLETLKQKYGVVLARSPK